MASALRARCSRPGPSSLRPPEPRVPCTSPTSTTSCASAASRRSSGRSSWAPATTTSTRTRSSSSSRITPRRDATLDANTLVNLAAGLFILPFVLLSATAGQLADKYEKSRLIRYIKLFEIAIMVIGTAGFYLPSLSLLFVALLLMGVHSTLFGPVKYAILPQHLKPEELVGGNGLVEMGTFVAILHRHHRRRRAGRDAGRRARCSRGSPPSPWRSPGWLVSRANPRDAGGRARPRDQLEPVHRDVEEPALRLRQPRASGCRCSASRGSGSTARPS